ncbi:hypothetical protein SteCoe_22314 [Stentor coeruleus]|uniref:Uncharacterized protein n=1 Tax=Stentor coeruleus TaxID=5963 RepID=A0A1R2BMK8_9CILI|nr:hypothetical protein SteCoe_22314 [Stentor coeruleus]
MDLTFVANYDSRAVTKLAGLGYDLDALFLLCQELLNLQSDLKLDNGDLRDLVFRMKNRYNYMNGDPVDLKLRCEDASPSRITFQPNGFKTIFYFTRCEGQNDVPYKEASFFCELCGPSGRLYKKEIKSHVAYAHKNG